MGALGRVEADAHVLDGAGDQVLGVDLQLGDVHQDTPRVILHVVGIVGVAANDRLVERNLPVDRPVWNRDGTPAAGILLDLVQVVDHQSPFGPPRGDEPAGYAFLVTLHGILAAGSGQAFRQVPADMVEGPAPDEAVHFTLENGLGGKGLPQALAEEVGQEERRRRGLPHGHPGVGDLEPVVEPPHESSDDGPLGADGESRPFAVRVGVDDGGADQVRLEQQFLSLADLGQDLGDKARFPVQGLEGEVKVRDDKVDPLLDLVPRGGVVVFDHFFEQRRDPGVGLACVHPHAGDRRSRGIDRFHAQGRIDH